MLEKKATVYAIGLSATNALVVFHWQNFGESVWKRKLFANIPLPHPGLNSRSVKSDTVSSVTTVATFLRSCVAPDAIGLGDAPRQSNASRL